MPSVAQLPTECSLSPPEVQSGPATAYLPHDQASTPTLDICNQMNAEIRANPTLDAPYFDLAAHVANRTYCLHNIEYGSSPDETAALLDVGVLELIPAPLPASSTPRKRKNPLFAVRPSTDAEGVGLFAVREIPVGGPILIERPALITPYIIGVDPAMRPALLDALLRRLTPSTAARILALANCRPATECGVLEGIVRTNAIDITLPVPDMPHAELETHRAIFLTASRLNHSCGPNAKWTWDAASFSLSLEALRPIPADAEITVAYVATDAPRAIRRAALQSTHNFTCFCALCARPEAAICQSDAARAELAAFWVHTPSFEDWCIDAHLPDHALVAAHGRALRLIEGEGLEVLGVGAHLDAVAMSYGALGDVERFRAAAVQARDARRGAAAKVLQKWIEKPESFPVWGWRKSLTRPERSSSHSSPSSAPADYFSIPVRPEYSTSPTGEFSISTPSTPLYAPSFPPLYTSAHSSPTYSSPPLYSSPYSAPRYAKFSPPPLYSPPLWPTYSSPPTRPRYYRSS